MKASRLWTTAIASRGNPTLPTFWKGTSTYLILKMESVNGVTGAH